MLVYQRVTGMIIGSTNRLPNLSQPFPPGLPHITQRHLVPYDHRTGTHHILTDETCGAVALALVPTMVTGEIRGDPLHFQ